MIVPPAAVVAVAAVAALVGASAVTVLLVSENLAGVAIAAATVAGGVAVFAATIVGGVDVTSSLAAARGGAGKPQKGTATVRNCRGCGVIARKGVTSAAVMGAMGLLWVAGLEGVSRCGGALLLSGCCWLCKWLMVAGVTALPVPMLLSLLELAQLFSLLEICELFSSLELQELAVDPLLLPTRSLLPVLNGVMGVLPPLTEVPSPLAWVLPAAGEGLATVPRVASSLRLTEGSTTGEPQGGDRVLLVPGAVPADEEVELDNFRATASWRACASPQQQGVTILHLRWDFSLMELIDMRG